MLLPLSHITLPQHHIMLLHLPTNQPLFITNLLLFLLPLLTNLPQLLCISLPTSLPLLLPPTILPLLTRSQSTLLSPTHMSTPWQMITPRLHSVLVKPLMERLSLDLTL